MDACRTLANPRQAARHRFQGLELVGARFWTLAARLQIRDKRPGTVFRAQNSAAGVFGRLPHACKSATSGQAPFSGLRTRRRAFFGRLPHACKSATSGQAPFSGLRTRRRAFLDACRTLANPRQAARHRFQGSELGGGRFWTLAARLQIRDKRPGTVFRAQNSAAGVFGRLPHACKSATSGQAPFSGLRTRRRAFFGRLPHACKSATSGQAPFSGLRTRRRAFLDACRTLANPRQAARHRFQGSELGGGRFWTLAARLQIRDKRPGTVFRAQNSAAGVFGRLPHACKSATSGQAPVSGPRTRRRAFLDACRTLANPRQAARHRFQGSELGGGRFWTLAARLQIRDKRPGTVFRAQNSAAGVFGRLPHACKSATSGQAPFSGLRTRRRAFFGRLPHACKSATSGQAPFSGLRTRRRAFFGRLPHACKSATSGQAPFSGLRTRRRAFLDACRTLANPRQAARHRFQGSELGGGRFWTLAARLQIRDKRPGTVFRAQNSAAGVFWTLAARLQIRDKRPGTVFRAQNSAAGVFWTLAARLQIRDKRPGTVFRAQNSAAGVFGRLPHACKSATSGQALFSGLRTRRRAFLDACRTLANPRQAARHRFQGSELGGGRFWTLAARLQIRDKRPGTVFRAQNSAAGVFGRLPHACKSATSGQAPFSGLRTRRRAFFGRLPHACKSATSGQAPFSGLRTRRRAFLDACRTLANPRQAARHRFQGSELGGGRFWTLAARLQIRDKRPGTVFRAQNSAAGVFGRLPHACKSATSGQAPFSGLRTRRRAFLDACRTLANPRQAARHRFQGSELGGGRFLDACRTLANPRQAARHRFQGSELGGGRFWTLAARLQIRDKRPGTVFRAQNSAAGVFGRLPHACKSATRHWRSQQNIEEFGELPRSCPLAAACYALYERAGHYVGAYDDYFDSCLAQKREDRR